MVGLPNLSKSIGLSPLSKLSGGGILGYSDGGGCSVSTQIQDDETNVVDLEASDEVLDATDVQVKPDDTSLE